MIDARGERVIDAFVSLFPPQAAARVARSEQLQGVASFFGDTPLNTGAISVDDIATLLRESSVTGALLTGRLSAGTADGDGTLEVLAACDRHPDLFRGAVIVDRIRSIREVTAAIATAASHPLFRAVRIVPMLQGEPINSRTYYPIYARCEELQLTVTVNVGVPGPRLRAADQHPLALDDVCIDFPDLTVVAAHMGHPWEALLIRLMMKYPRLFLSNSGYLATYMEDRVIRFMNSSRGRGKLIFASDFPLLGMQKSLDAARKLPISAEALRAFLGDNAAAAFRWDGGGAER